MKREVLSLSMLLILIATGAFAGEKSVVVLQNPDKTLTSIFYSKGKEVAKQIRSPEGIILKTTGKVPDGSVEEFSRDGKLMAVSNYKNGKLEGIGKEYYPSGELLEEILYANDKREGISKKYYKSGKILAERYFKDGLLEDLTTMYYESGKLFVEMHYKGNKLDGESKIYYENGIIKSIETYENNKKIRLRSYDQQGKLLGDVDLRSGKSMKTTTTVVPKKEGKPDKKSKK